jgi:hypothetical protein
MLPYDLRRLRLNGLIRRIEHTHTYVLTPDGQRIAIFTPGDVEPMAGRLA